jgi:hypothetical protein
MEDEEHACYDAHFLEELDSLKVNMARIISLLEQKLKHLYGEGLSNRPVVFSIIQPKERMKGHA